MDKTTKGQITKELKMKTEKGFTTVEVTLILVIMGILFGIGYVVVHFISKLW